MINHYSGIIRTGQKKAKPVCDIAVVIALYNQGQYIVEAVKSIYDNTWHPAEVVIVDDCSTDDSAVIAFNVISDYVDKMPSVKLIKNDTNRHLSGARNVGIKSTRSPWIVCLDADDKLEVNYFEQVAAWQKASKADVIYTDAKFFDAVKGDVLFPNFDKLILRVRNICLASSAFSREVYDKCGGYDERFKHGLEDYALWLKACQLGFKFAKCETTGLYYRRHVGSMSAGNIFGKYKQENYALLKEVFGDFYLGRG
jgi:glycosyltransferase involved in cell wall biosynthesis